MTERLTPPPVDDAERARKAALLLSLLRAMVVMALFGFVASLFDARNDLRVSLGFYVPILLGIWWLNVAVKRGRVILAAWSVSLFFWGIIAFVTLFLGGLQGQNAASFGVVAMLIGTVVSGRAGLTLAIVSSVWCGFVALLELRHALPPQLGPSYSPINAWAAVTVTLIFVTVLMRNTLDSLRAMHAQQVTLAAQRDEALRRSIQSQKMELVGNLAGGVAHDFNNLLSVIGSVSELLRSELGGKEAEREMLDDLDEATSRAVLMTRQLLSFTRTEPSELSDVDVGEQVRAIAPMLRRLVGPAIAVDIEAPQGAIVRATRVGLEQVLLNLAVNARDAMPSGGTLGIHVQVDEDAVRVSVKDTGIGMDQPTRARIFEPFFTTKSTGTGLGLATVRERLVEFGGTITVESERGAGSVFALRLARAASAPASSSASRSATASAPASASTTRSASGSAPASAPASTPASPAALPPAAAEASPPAAVRLLLVDDDAFVRRAMTRLLEQSGFEVVAVSNGAEALALLEREHAFACVVSDVVMPVLDGEALAARLSELDPSLPLVLMSGNRQPSASLLGPRRGFVEKPVDRRALLDTIRRVTRVTVLSDRRVDLLEPPGTSTSSEHATPSSKTKSLD